MKKRFLGLLLSGIFMVGSTFSISANAQGYSEEISVQESAAAAYDELMTSFSSTYSNEKIYPDYYGGSYINDNGKLVVYVTNEGSQPTILQSNEDVIYEPCTYSYNELLSVMDELNEYKFNQSDTAIANGFNEFGLYDSENSIIVKLDDLSEQSIKEFKENVSDSEAIKFEQGIGPIQMEADVNAGSSISVPSATASVGYRVKRGSVEGFVTAGHAASAGETISSGGTSFASCVVSQQSGNADAAFCKITNTSYSPTNTLAGTSNTLSTTISEPGVGTVINKIGKSTGATSGKVLSTNVTATFSSGATISNLTTADYTSAPGDSGGVVYSYISSTNARLTLGIHTGAGGSTRYYTKANEINSALGTKRY